MAGLSASGIGSGLDIDGIVKQLMSIEREPLQQLDERISDYNSQLSAYGQLKSTLDSFESSMDGLSSVNKFQVFSATSADSDVYSATADEFASTGSYDISVETLAQNHKVGSAITGIASDTTIGGNAGDQLDITVGTNTLSLDLSGGKTLAQIKDLINASADNPGVKATIVSGSDTDQRLVLTADESGQDNAISFTETFDAASTSLGLDHINIADGSAAELEKLDAKVIVDGMTVLRSSNTIDDIIQGVTLELKDDTQAGTTFQLDVARDDKEVISTVNDFIKAYNTVMDKLDSMHKEGGKLEGDNTIISIQSQLRDRLNSTVDTGGSFNYLAELGITTNTSTGKLELDEDTLTDAMDEDFDAVANIFAKENEGIAFLLEKEAYDLTTYDGLLDNRKEGIETRIENYEDQKLNMEYRLELVQERYQKQYGGLDSTLASMQSMGNYLAAQLASLPGF